MIFKNSAHHHTNLFTETQKRFKLYLTGLNITKSIYKFAQSIELVSFFYNRLYTECIFEDTSHTRVSISDSCRLVVACRETPIEHYL